MSNSTQQSYRIDPTSKPLRFEKCTGNIATTTPSSLEDQLCWISSMVGEQYAILEELGKKLAPLTLPVDHAAESSIADPSSMTSPACERLRSIARSLDYHNNMIKSLMQNLTL